MLLKVSTTRNRTFLLVQSSDHLTGLTGATPTVTLSKDGGAFGAAGGTVTEIANGVYKIALTTTDTNTKGDLFYHVTAASADATDFADQVVTDLPGDTVASVTGAVGSVTAGVTVTTNNDKTGYSLTQTFPTNFSSLAITAGGAVTVGTNNDKTGYSLTVTPPTSAQIATAVWQDTTAADFTTASSIGKSLYTSGNAPGAASGLALVGSNMGTVTSVTGAVGSVTGNVGGNVVGSVASVTGAVGSVTARVTANTDQINGTTQTARDLGLALPAAAPGAAGGVFIAGTNAATTITGADAAGATPATPALTLVGGAASTTGGGVSAPAVLATGGAGAASTNGAAVGVKFAGGGTNTVASSAHGFQVAGTSTGSGLVATSGNGASGDGILAQSFASNGHGFEAAGNGGGHGVFGESGGGATGDGIKGVSFSTNGNGINGVGTGTGAGLRASGGATGPGAKLIGGATSGDGLDITTTSGDGISILPTAGSAIVATGNGTSKFGIIATGGTAGTSDGVKAVAGTGGVPIRGDLTGNIHGTLDTLTTYTGNTPQTGDAFARLGAPAGASTSADIAGVKTDTGNISTQVVSTRAEPSSVPAATSTLGTKVDWLFALARNKRTTTATVDTLRNDADGATIGTSTISDDGTTFVRSKYV